MSAAKSILLRYQGISKKLHNLKCRDARRKFIRRLPWAMERLEDRRVLSVVLSGIPEWTEQGPGPITLSNGFIQAGAIEAIAVDPNNSDRAFVGTVNGGIWRTDTLSYSPTDGVDNDNDTVVDEVDEVPSWDALTDQFNSLSISAIAISPANPNVIYAGTGRTSAGFGDGGSFIGVLRSTDGGDSWMQVGPELVGRRIRSIVPTGQNDPMTGQEVVLLASDAGAGGVYRSEDAGTSFTKVPGVDGASDGIDNDGDATIDEANESQAASHLVADPGNPMRYYAGIPQVGVFRSDDLGDTWNPVNGTGGNVITGIAPQNFRTELAVHNSGGNNVVYAAIIRNDVALPAPFNARTNRVFAMFRSTDMGTNWRQIQNMPVINPGAQAGAHFSMIAHPTNSNVLFVGGDAPDPSLAPSQMTRYRAAMNDAAPAMDAWQLVADSGTIDNTRPHADSRDFAFALDGNGNLSMLNADDGGIYRLFDPDNAAANRRWESVNGDIRVTESYSIGYDSLNNTITTGTQDNGTARQRDNADPLYPFDWNNIQGGDGAVITVDNDQVVHPNETIIYTSSQNLGGFTQRTIDNTNTQSGTSGVGLTVIGTGGRTLTGPGVLAMGTNLVFDNSIQFIQPHALNNIDKTRMIIGTNYLYESFTSGNTLVSLGGLIDMTNNGSDDDGDGMADPDPDEWAPANQVGAVRQAAYPQSTPIAYGGMADGMPNPDVLWVGAGGNLLLRTTPGGLPNVVANYTSAAVGGGPITDIVMDPDDWHTAYVVDLNGSVFRAVTNDAGTNVTFTNLTGNLGDFTVQSLNPDLRTIEFIRTDSANVLLVGGQNGVYRTINPNGNPVWSELGLNLPNAPVNDLTYTPPIDGPAPFPGDVLAVGLFGRGVWTIDDASDVLGMTGGINVCGDSNHVNQDDEFVLIRNQGNPLLIDVFVNNVLEFQGPLAAIQQINVFGVGGDDSLNVDSTFGLIGVPAGIRYDGDGACPDSQPGFGYDRGVDVLVLSQDGGVVQTTDTYSVGPAAGSGSSMISGPGGTQAVFFEELEPVFDFVPATDLIVNATDEANLVNYAGGALVTTGRVTIDSYETIEFAEKVALTINAGLGDDTVMLTNSLVPSALSQVSVNAGDGNDSVVTRSDAAALPQMLDGGTGDDFLVGGLNSNMISGGLGFDTIGVLGTPDNNTIDVRQDDSVTLTSIIDGDTRTDTFDTVEAVRVDAAEGEDAIRVTHDDSLVGAASSSLPFEVFGGGPNAGDRLAVRDDGIGDTVIYRKGADDWSGSVTVGPLAPVRFEQIEYLDVTPLDGVTGGTGSDGEGRLVVFKPDPFENNNSRTTATYLGGGEVINVDPLIDPGPFAPLSLPGDTDWFEVVAAETGVLDFQVFFEQVAALSNGRAGLPGDGDIDVAVYDADGDLIESSNSTTDNERVTIAAVRNETYYLRVDGFNEGVNAYNLSIFNVPAPVPFQVDLQAASDSGRNDTDDITNNTSPTFDVYLDDDRLEEFTNIDLAPDDDYFVELYNNGVLLGVAAYQGPGLGVDNNSRWQFTAAPGDLQQGHNNFITAAVRMRDEADPRVIGRGEFSIPLQVTLDTIAPSGTANLFPDSDTAIWGFPETMTDLVTADKTPLLYGATEANALVRASIDDVPGGTTVALPYDGDEAFPPPPEYDGNYFLQTILNLEDGEHTIEVFFRDVAGNESLADEDATLVIFVDTQGPRITNVTRGAVSTDNVFSFDGVTSVFEPKPSETGPDPLVHSIVIHFSDLPDRTAAFADVPALFEQLAAEEGNYSLKGDHNGNIAIVGVNVTFTTIPDDGLPEEADVELIFDMPLPDDRYTLWVSDSISDPAGNPLDGESGALGPFDGNDVPDETPPIFPTGDGEHGGDFHGRFTIDSRPEIGTFALGTTYIDINGNFVFDAEGKDRDYTNRDIVFQFGLRDDRVFAGNFAAADAASATGYDKLGAYGVVGQGAGAWYWRLDFDHDGVIDYEVLSGKQISGDPVAGDFDPAHPGDEIGLFDGNKWFLDTSGDNNIGGPGDTQLQGDMRGFPVVGDFDGDGLDDLATWNPGNQGLQTQGRFEFDLANNGLSGNIEQTIAFDLAGVFERPVAADMNGDGIDDLGLFVTRREGVPPEESGEWFFLISDAGAGDVAAGEVTALNHAFTPVPFGTDIFAQFGDELALPVVGNFDPPTGDLPDPLDTNRDGSITSRDALVVVNALARMNSATIGEATASSYDYNLDANRDGAVTARDALFVINRLGRMSEFTAEAEAVEVPQASWSFAADSAGNDLDDDDDLLMLLAADQAALL